MNKNQDKQKNLNDYENNVVGYCVKDNFWTQNSPTTACSNFLLDFYPSLNSTVVELLDNASYHLTKKAIMDEFACGGTGLHANVGPIFNPHDFTRIVGGSSSGSAFAVYNNQVLFALGSDSGGSVRTPAAHVGIIGFKPSYGAVSRFGLIPMSSSLDTVGVLARSIPVVKQIYHTIARLDSLDLQTVLYWKWKESDSRKVISNKVAVIRGIERYLPTQYAKLYYSFLDSIRKQYCVEEITIPLKIKDNLQFGWLAICFTELVSHLNALQGITFGNKEKISVVEKRSKYLGPVVKERLMIGAFLLENGVVLDQVYKWREYVRKWVNKTFSKYEFLVFPSTTDIASKVEKNSFVAIGSEEHWSNNLILLANLAGFPSLTLPLGKINDLPVGICLNSRKGNDEKLLLFSSEFSPF